MPSAIIVAIPAEDDYVWKLSSEKVPHLTLLYLGEQSPGPALAHIQEFLEHVAKTSLSRFGLSVDRRGVLGDKDADVLFFDEECETKVLKDVRSYLLADQTTAEAYNSTEQFPGWTPHLTLGYPETPANPDLREYPGIHWVNFDRIALWTGDYEGIEFRLERPDTKEVYMSRASAAVEDVLSHYGVKGMKWGVRKDGTPHTRRSAKKEAKADAKWEKTIYSTPGAIKVHNAMAEHFNSRVGAINDRHPDADLVKSPDSPQTKAYMDEVMALERKSYNHAVTNVHGSSPSGKKKAYYVEDEDGARIEVRSSEVEHADVDEPDLIILVKRNARGHIVEMNTAEAVAEHSASLEDVLAHYGVKGMKWGVRKSDSSPTDVVVTQKKPGTRVKSTGGKNQPASEDAKKAAAARQKAKKSTVDSLSNQELQALVKRMQLEQQLTQLSAQRNAGPLAKGHKFVKSLLGAGKTANEVAAFQNSPAGKQIKDQLKKDK